MAIWRVMVGLWIERVRFWGKKLDKSEAAYGTGTGAALTFWGGWLLFLWGFTIRWWHKHAMGVKAEDHHLSNYSSSTLSFS